MVKDQEKVRKYINIAKGQLEGIIRMIDEDRYCLDISDQLMATRSLLKKTNNLILKNHIDNCVRNAIKDGDSEKLDEVIRALEKQI
ncbi:MAG: metal-sensing transcriptional repressor [Erysipelotrichaceae bacterium]|nr:metal-sensing transcriptional repressor [Erysipelotrichaceae bacterium]